jgi:puromycin-sensitive aminopeptidase
VLRQQRFLYDGGDDDATQWVVPVRVRQLAGDAERIEKVLLDGDEVRLPRLGPDAAVVANAGGHGFYRVSYAPELLGALQGPALAALSTAERYGLVDDTWAGVVAGRTPALAFCQLALAFADETELAVWQILLAGLRTCDRIVPADERAAFQGYVRALLTPALERLGWDRADGDSDLRAELRGVVIRGLAVLGNDAATIERAWRTFADGSPDPEVQAACTTVVAATGDEADYDRFVEGYRSAPTPQERLRFLYALAEFPSAELLDRTLAFAFGGEVRTQNAPFLLNHCIAHRELGERAWAFVRQRWDDATKLFPDNLIVRMVDPVKLLVQPHQQAEVAAFFAEHPIPQAARTLDQVLERPRINVALAERDGAALGAGIGAIAR